ncbi:uncharacterized protein [Nicotiana tomentosiformis]|uniref:uncharacterized protein n=1 Tax=Nicotiana tomentosiformis TaxID=4098 RepID=UPI00388CE145
MFILIRFFEAGGYKWKMIIYPDGNGSEKGSEHISVYLAISETSSLPSGWEVNAMFTFFLFNQLCDNYLTVRGVNLDDNGSKDIKLLQKGEKWKDWELVYSNAWHENGRAKRRKVKAQNSKMKQRHGPLREMKEFQKSNPRPWAREARRQARIPASPIRSWIEQFRPSSALSDINTSKNDFLRVTQHL